MRTTKDWLEQARRPGEDARACLRGAEEAARFPDDWNDVAGAWIELGDLAAARRCVDAAIERAAGEQWPSRNAATLLAGPLGDRAAAADALGRIEAALAAVATAHCGRWTWLAQTYRVVLGDEAAVARCLAEAGRRAREATDLAEVAEGRLALDGDRQAARALLERAQALASPREQWTIAIRWKSEALADDARARAALEAGTAAASDVRTLAALAMGWRSLFDDDAGVRAALARAETLAATAAEWLDAADGWFDGGKDARAEPWDEAGVRRCLEAALAAAPTDEDRGRIARAFRQRLGDDARAAEIAPAGQAPEERVAAAWPLPAFPRRDPRALLHRVRERLDDRALAAMAKADYGWEWTKHHRALVEIARTGLMPLPIDWVPLEVLELTRWDRGDGTDHARRAFAAVLLALDQAVPGCRQAGEIQDSLAPLVESAWQLGLEDDLEQCLVWLAEVLDPETNQAWPLLGLVLTLARRDPRDPRLPALVARLEEAVASMRGEGPWLFGTTRFDQSFDIWRDLAARALVGELPPELARLAARLTPRPEGPFNGA